MKKLMVAGVVVMALAFTVSASAALVPGVFDPGSTGCVKATFSKKEDVAPGEELPDGDERRRRRRDD